MRTHHMPLALVAVLVSSASVLAAQQPQEERQKYSNAQHGISFEYAASWTIMTPDEVAQKTKGVINTKGVIVFVVNDRDADKNVNIRLTPLSQQSASAAELRQLETDFDREGPRMFNGFKRVSARVVTVAGVKCAGVCVRYHSFGQAFSPEESQRCQGW